MQMRRTGVSVPMALLCSVALIVLSACTIAAGSGPKQPGQDDASPSPTAPVVVAPITSLADSPGDELFTFSATAVTDYGAQLQVTMTIHQPVAWDSTAGTQIIDYLEAHDVSTSMTDATWDTQNSVSLGVMDISATAAGDPWLEGSAVQLDLGPFIGRDVVLGLVGHDAFGHFVLETDGMGHAIIAFPAYDGSPDPSAWAEPGQIYGLSPSPGSTDASGEAPTLRDCSMEFSEIGKLNDWVANWHLPTADSCQAGITG
jgi:hypothetical protein